MLKALLVDDEVNNLATLEFMLRHDCEEVEVVGKAQSARQARQWLQSHTADVVFLDINMPIVDGFVFLYEFDKFNELVKNKCKIIILSSSDNKRDIDKIVNNNHVIKFITKPLTESALDEIKLNSF